MLEPKPRIFRVHGVDRAHQDAIRAYLHEKVSEWCASHATGSGFAARDLIGGENRNWVGTPLQYLYDYYRRRNRGDVYAYREAAKAAGRILKGVIDIDEDHTFHITGGYRTVRYILL